MMLDQVDDQLQFWCIGDDISDRSPFLHPALDAVFLLSGDEEEIEDAGKDERHESDR